MRPMGLVVGPILARTVLLQWHVKTTDHFELPCTRRKQRDFQGPMLGIDVVDIGNYGTYDCMGRRRNELVSKTIYIVPIEIDSKDVV